MIADSTYPFVSVVIPVYNEEKYITACVDSLLLQDYPPSRIEWIFVDGGSADDTVALIKVSQLSKVSCVYIANNPNKTVPYAMNIGIKQSRGEYIVRMDAHAEYASDYISRCIEVLGETGADNVGGVMVTKSRGFVGATIAKMLSSKFGVGNSSFRTDGEDGYVDTVPFGAFKRDVFEKWGYYDERLTRNQDNEMNFRIRNHGGKIYLSNKINLAYYCRDTISGVLGMALQNGEWNIVAMRLCPGSMGVRHFVPLLFVVSVLGFLLLSLVIPFFGTLLAAELLAYLTLDGYFAISGASGFKQGILLFALYPLFHICYGIGSLKGLLKIARKDFARR